MNIPSSKPVAQSLSSGLVGALVLTIVHESVRHLRPIDAPRMDILGERGLRRLLFKVNAPQPDEEQAYWLTMLGDVASNGLYYSLVGTGRGVWWRGVGLGLAAGIGAVVLPGPLGLGTAPSTRTPQTKAMTVAWYLLGGLVAAGTSWVLNKKESRSSFTAA